MLLYKGKSLYTMLPMPPNARWPLALVPIHSYISELNCPICLGVLRQPIQLPLVCGRCLTEWIHQRCSFSHWCYDTSPLECTQVNPAYRMVQLLLNDVMVLCASCKRNVRAVDYDTQNVGCFKGELHSHSNWRNSK